MSTGPVPPHSGPDCWHLAFVISRGRRGCITVRRVPRATLGSALRPVDGVLPPASHHGPASVSISQKSRPRPAARAAWGPTNMGHSPGLGRWPGADGGLLGPRVLSAPWPGPAGSWLHAGDGHPSSSRSPWRLCQACLFPVVPVFSFRPGSQAGGWGARSWPDARPRGQPALPDPRLPMQEPAWGEGADCGQPRWGAWTRAVARPGLAPDDHGQG